MGGVKWVYGTHCPEATAQSLVLQSQGGIKPGPGLTFGPELHQMLIAQPWLPLGVSPVRFLVVRRAGKPALGRGAWGVVAVAG